MSACCGLEYILLIRVYMYTNRFFSIGLSLSGKLCDRRLTAIMDTFGRQCIRPLSLPDLKQDDILKEVRLIWGEVYYVV